MMRGLTRGQIALQGDLRIVFAELASHQFHQGCERGRAILQLRAGEYDYDERHDDYDEYCDGGDYDYYDDYDTMIMMITTQ